MAFLNSIRQKISHNVLSRNLSTTSPLCVLKKCVLPNRALIKVEGEEAPDFLQGLMTNDIEHLDIGEADISTANSFSYAKIYNEKKRNLFSSNQFRLKFVSTNSSAEKLSKTRSLFSIALSEAARFYKSLCLPDAAIKRLIFKMILKYIVNFFLKISKVLNVLKRDLEAQLFPEKSTVFPSNQRLY